MDVVNGALYVLSWILAVMFLKTGLVEVTSRLFPKEHQQTSEDFELYASVCPTKLFGYTPQFIRVQSTRIHVCDRVHTDACFIPAFAAFYRITPLDVFSILCHDEAFNLQP